MVVVVVVVVEKLQETYERMFYTYCNVLFVKLQVRLMLCVESSKYVRVVHMFTDFGIVEVWAGTNVRVLGIK